MVDYHTVVFGAIAAVDELASRLTDSGASTIFAHPEYYDVVFKAAEKANIPKTKIFFFGEKEFNRLQNYRSLIGDHEIVPVSYTSEEARTTTAILCYSSGTVGEQKGVEITHTNIVANAAQLMAVDDFGKDDIFMGGLGGTTVVIPKLDTDIKKLCDCIQNYKISYAHVIPQTILKFATNPIVKNYISSLRMICSGASPLSKESNEKFSEILKIPIKQLYGPNEGEICIRGPNVMKVILDISFDEYGFFHTGDIARIDNNVELEEILLTHPAVADVAVIGHYSEQNLTEHPTAYIVKKPDHKKTLELKSEIQKYINDKVAPHKKLRGGVYFINQIPKTPSGKILRRILRKRLEKGPDLKNEHEVMRKDTNNIQIFVLISINRSSNKPNSWSDADFIEGKRFILDNKSISSGTSASAYVETERLPALFEKKNDAIDSKSDPQEVYVHEIRSDFQQDHLIALNTCWVAEHPNRTEVFLITDNFKELNKYMEYLMSSVGLETQTSEVPANLTIEEKLGRGGFGTVYRAKSRSLGDVAIKEIDLETDEMAQNVFRNE
ncbi:15313_t:CDS:10, partial [Racocetra fulgida]